MGVLIREYIGIILRNTQFSTRWGRPIPKQQIPEMQNLRSLGPELQETETTLHTPASNTAASRRESSVGVAGRGWQVAEG